jgi:hypothetical protein
VVCLGCGAELDDCWWWCPECGSKLVVSRESGRQDELPGIETESQSV